MKKPGFSTTGKASMFIHTGLLPSICKISICLFQAQSCKKYHRKCVWNPRVSLGRSVWDSADAARVRYRDNIGLRILAQLCSSKSAVSQVKKD